jgi:hypothetical protein
MLFKASFSFYIQFSTLGPPQLTWIIIDYGAMTTSLNTLPVCAIIGERNTCNAGKCEDPLSDSGTYLSNSFIAQFIPGNGNLGRTCTILFVCTIVPFQYAMPCMPCYQSKMTRKRHAKHGENIERTRLPN